jgi:hypothetical protein
MKIWLPGRPPKGRGRRSVCAFKCASLRYEWEQLDEFNRKTFSNYSADATVADLEILVTKRLRFWAVRLILCYTYRVTRQRPVRQLPLHEPKKIHIYNVRLECFGRFFHKGCRYCIKRCHERVREYCFYLIWLHNAFFPDYNDMADNKRIWNRLPVVYIFGRDKRWG